jgi:hypothetical protein
MTPAPDFRALCAELAVDVEEWMVAIDHFPPSSVELLNRARAALATPPPEPPTDDELMALAVAVFEDPYATDKDYARAVLERWGK